MSRKTATLLMSAVDRAIYPIGETRRHTGQRSEQVLALPYYGFVPKEPIANLRWRIYVRKRARADLAFRHAIMDACEEDILFFANTLVNIFEPRGKPRMIPWNTWEDQDDVIVWLDEGFGQRDCGVDKTRAIGLSWDIDLVFYHHWYFWSDCHMGMISWHSKVLDGMDNPGTLMGKLDWIHRFMPSWWRHRPGVVNGQTGDDAILYRTYNDHRFVNLANNSTIIGAPPSADAFSGDRKTAIAFDEVAKFPLKLQDALISMQYVSDCRYLISTMREGSPRFYSLMYKEESDMLRIRAYWWDNKERSAGKYKVVRGRVIRLDPAYEYPEDYKFNYPHPMEDLIRSPWVDSELRRLGNKDIHSTLIELYGILATTNSRIFQPDALENAEKTVRAAYSSGTLDYVIGKWEPLFHEENAGKLRLWIQATNGKLAHGGPYAFGADPAGGTGSDTSNNCVLSVLDIPTGEQVAEFAANDLDAIQFAQLCYVAAKWFGGNQGQGWVIMNFDSLGPYGGNFKKELSRLNWHNFYQREENSYTFKFRTKNVGSANTDGGVSILYELQRAFRAGEIKPRSAEAVEECRAYEIGEDGKLLFHAREVIMGQRSGRVLSHGDRAMALAIAWQARQERKPSIQHQDDPEVDLADGTLVQKPRRGLKGWAIPSVLGNGRRR